MVAIFQSSITADDVKAKARELGADLVGIADGSVMNDNPPYPDDPKSPADITEHDADRVIVLARRLSLGTSRIQAWDNRHKFYNDELTITALEETALELVLWLEEQGYPALMVPPTHVDPWKYDGNPDKHLSPLLSMDHAAVEAGLGTLGLNLQLLTPEYGPRVMMIAVLTSAPLDADSRLEQPLCQGPECGRCLSACPGDVIGQWERDWRGCDSYRNPHGFNHLTEFLGNVIDQTDPETQKKMIRSEDSFNLWQSILRGAGAVIGCRRCQDVCPVGEDYDSMLKDAVHEIAEDSPEKQIRLKDMVAGGEGNYLAQSRWIGILEK
ncbi:MAG: epoxyqueuosine reductase [Rhodospirillaceae bacterium]|jgi:epoxyqueuosine reductase|nr:epoxyqueuosine reductase [Rhodospirillaceae bacterium]MBT5940856.1 epoxyqueuosine reductase [Rhodospirillaceae bacterium]MBT7265993.1 epoxyqueuosine reductase [Rhodospirillaceae bacterium]